MWIFTQKSNEKELFYDRIEFLTNACNTLAKKSGTEKWKSCTGIFPAVKFGSECCMILILFKKGQRKTADETPSAALLICRPASTARTTPYRRRRSADEENFIHSSAPNTASSHQDIAEACTNAEFSQRKIRHKPSSPSCCFWNAPRLLQRVCTKNNNSIFTGIFQPSDTKFRFLSARRLFPAYGRSHDLIFYTSRFSKAWNLCRDPARKIFARHILQNDSL